MARAPKGRCTKPRTAHPNGGGIAPSPLGAIARIHEECSADDRPSLDAPITGSGAAGLDAPAPAGRAGVSACARRDASAREARDTSTSVANAAASAPRDDTAAALGNTVSRINNASSVPPA